MFVGGSSGLVSLCWFPSPVFPPERAADVSSVASKGHSHAHAFQPSACLEYMFFCAGEELTGMNPGVYQEYTSRTENCTWDTLGYILAQACSRTSMKRSAKRICAELQLCSLRDRTQQGESRRFSRVWGWLGVWEGLRIGKRVLLDSRVLSCEEGTFWDTLVGGKDDGC